MPYKTHDYNTKMQRKVSCEPLTTYLLLAYNHKCMEEFQIVKQMQKNTTLKMSFQ